MMQRVDDPTHDYLLALTGKERPKVLFLPTATGDQDAYIVLFYETYTADKCEPAHLRLFSRSVRDLRSYILGFDIIHVGGGNTANMLDVWKRQGVDEILREAWEGGAVMTGGSAGAICWFEGGTTDSYGPDLQVLPEGLGFIPGSMCPHYDAEDQRRPLFHQALLDGSLPTGYAVGNLESAVFEGTELKGAVSSQADGLALKVEAIDGKIVETPLPLTVLETTSTGRGDRPAT